MNKQTIRKEKALQRLENQLAKGNKPATKGRNGNFEEIIPLTESDIKRIKSEIATLKLKVS